MKTIIVLLFNFLFFSEIILSQDYIMQNGTFSTCSGMFYDNGGNSSNYSNNQNLTLTFSSSNGNRIQINFQSFTLENGPDYLQIYDGISTSAPLIGSFTGNNSPGVITSTGTSLTLRFVSDNSVNYAGWAANISCTTPSLTVYNMTNGQTITACSGVFYDSGGPTNNYYNNENITMTFCPQSTNDILVFNFPYLFNISGDDTLWAYSGSTTTNPLIGIYTRNNIKESIVSPTPGQCITFLFKSNSTNNTAGWQGIFECMQTAPTINFNMGHGVRYICSGNFYDSGGPTANYSQNEDKTVTFVATDGCVIRLNFQLFNTENNIDRLFIYDGFSTNSPLIGTYSGTNSPGVVTSTGLALTLRFTSDGSVSYAGWQAVISCPNSPVANATSNSPVCVGSNIQLNATGGQSYNWSGPQGFTSNQAQVTIFNATPSNAGTYFVTVTAASGCTSVASTIVIIDENTINASATSNSPVCSGNTLYLSASGGTNYSWSGPNNFTSNIANPFIQNSSVVHSGTYYVTVTAGSACSDVVSVVVTVNQTPNANIQIVGNTLKTLKN